MADTHPTRPAHPQQSQANRRRNSDSAENEKRKEEHWNRWVGHAHTERPTPVVMNPAATAVNAQITTLLGGGKLKLLTVPREADLMDDDDDDADLGTVQVALLDAGVVDRLEELFELRIGPTVTLGGASRFAYVLVPRNAPAAAQPAAASGSTPVASQPQQQRAGQAGDSSQRG